MIEAIFAGYAIVALLLFRFVAPSSAVAITCFAGWLILPVGNFPAGSTSTVFPYWITGAAVPSDMLLTKMWWPPVIALAGALWTDRQTMLRWRPGWTDIPMVLWCLWPIGQWAFAENPEPQPWIASLYISAAWGAPWLLGRVYFGSEVGGRLLMAWMVAGMAVIVPIALIEGAFGPIVYEWFYGPHPFRFDGAERYVGFRPLGFFEHGNQYGIWVAAAALAAIWLWQTSSRMRSRLAAIATLSLAVALMSQSLGAVLLLCTGLVLLGTIGRSPMRWVLPLFLLLLVSLGAIYLSGKVPLRALAENTAIGRQMVAILRSSGRGSFTWRIARDQTALPLIVAHPIVGTARWDWWRKNDQRPWGLALLVLGQFGLIGSALAFGSLLMPTLRTLAIRAHSGAWRSHPTAPLAVIVLMASADALLNSFFFYPAILAVGALAHCHRSPQEPKAVGPAGHPSFSSQNPATGLHRATGEPAASCNVEFTSCAARSSLSPTTSTRAGLPGQSQAAGRRLAARRPVGSAPNVAKIAIGQSLGGVARVSQSSRKHQSSHREI
jgi:hypothetical protein